MRPKRLITFLQAVASCPQLQPNSGFGRLDHQRAATLTFGCTDYLPSSPRSLCTRQAGQTRLFGTNTISAYSRVSVQLPVTLVAFLFVVSYASGRICITLSPAHDSRSIPGKLPTSDMLALGLFAHTFTEPSSSSVLRRGFAAAEHCDGVTSVNSQSRFPTTRLQILASAPP